MDLLVDIQCIIFAQVLQHHAGNVFLHAVAPLHEQGIALQASGTGRVSIASERKLVCIAAEPSVGDFGGTLVGRLGGEGKAKEKTYDEQKFTLHCSIL